MMLGGDFWMIFGGLWMMLGGDFWDDFWRELFGDS